MRRMTWIAAIMLSFALVLSACGTKDVESVVKDLDKFLNSMEGYSGTGTMTLHNGQQPQTYQVEVAYQKPDAYRIELTNAEKDITQIVLRNEDGVFVLTPKQNKIFRFQSDWPQKQGQVYLYQTLVQSILLDSSRQFATTDDAYVFDVMAKYNSSSLARQKIWLSQDDYRPLQVEVSDTNANILVDVKFDTFEFNPRFDGSFFSTDANMNSNANPSTTEDQPTGAGELDTTATGDEGVGEMESSSDNESGMITEDNEAQLDGMDSDNDIDSISGVNSDEKGGKKNTGKKNTEQKPAENESNKPAENESNQPNQPNQPNSNLPNSSENQSNNPKPNDKGTPSSMNMDYSFVAMEASYMPLGVTLKDVVDIEYAGSPGLMTRYEGGYSYTLLQAEAKDIATTLVPGNFVDLGYTIGELIASNDIQTLVWTYNGNQYRLSSADLPELEMMKIAQSVQSEVSK